jgi:O-antigen/teichoic acid export membrane protein
MVMITAVRQPARLLPAPLQELVGRYASSPLAARLIHGSLWSLGGSLASRMFALLSAVLVARMLGKATYGQLGIMQSTIGMFGALAGFGMGTAASKFVAEFRHTDPARAGRVIALSSVVSWMSGITLAAALVLLAPALAVSALSSPGLGPYIQLSALLLLLNTVNGAQLGVLCGFEAFRAVSWINGLIGLLGLPLIVGGALLFQLWGVVWGLIVAQAVGCLVAVRIRKREAARLGVPMPSWSRAASELPLVWQFALPATLGCLLVNPVNWACTAMLAVQPHGWEHVGALNAANQWYGALLWFPYLIAQSVMPVLSERIGANDTARSAKVVVVSVKVTAAMTLPLVIIGSLLSKYIMGAYGREFVGDWPTLVVSLLTCAVVAVQVPVGNLVAASGRMWNGLGMNLLWAVVFLAATWLALDWGVLGLALARLVAYVAQGVWGGAFAFLWVRSSTAPAVTATVETCS